MNAGCIMPPGASPPAGSKCLVAIQAMRAFYKALPMCGASEATLRAVMTRFFTSTTVQHYTGGASGADSVGAPAIWSAMLPLLRAYPGAIFTEKAACWDEATGTAVLLMDCVGPQLGTLYGVIPAWGKTTCVPLWEAARVGPDGKFTEVWTCLDKFMLIDQIGAIDFMKPMIANVFNSIRAKQEAAAKGASDKP